MVAFVAAGQVGSARAEEAEGAWTTSW